MRSADGAIALGELRERTLSVHIEFLKEMDHRVNGLWTDIRDTQLSGEIAAFGRDLDGAMTNEEITALETELADMDREELEAYLAESLEHVGALAINCGHIMNRTQKTVREYIAEVPDAKIRRMLDIVWTHGDEEARRGIDEYLDGKSDIRFDLPPGPMLGRTTRESGRRVYHLPERLATASEKNELFEAALVLSHELHRDGLNRKDPADTRRAVYADIDIAKRMRETNEVLNTSVHVAMDIMDHIRTLRGSGALDRVIGQLFSSQADYWLLRADGGLEFDGDGWLRRAVPAGVLRNGAPTDANTRYIQRRNSNTGRIGSGGPESGLMQILRKVGIGDIPQEHVARLMRMAGLRHTNEPAGDTASWSWHGTDTTTGEDMRAVNQGRVLSQDMLYGHGLDTFTMLMQTFARVGRFSQDLRDYVLALIRSAHTYGDRFRWGLWRLKERFVNYEPSWSETPEAVRRQFHGEDDYRNLFATYQGYDDVFLAGGPAQWLSDHIVNYSFETGQSERVTTGGPGGGTVWPVHGDLVAPLNSAMVAFGRRLHQRNHENPTAITDAQARALAYEYGQQHLFVGYGGGLVPRFINPGDGTRSDSLSNHAFGAALDFNPPGNPQYATGSNEYRLLQAAANGDTTTIQNVYSAQARIHSLQAAAVANTDSEDFQEFIAQLDLVAAATNDVDGYAGLRELLSSEREYGRYQPLLAEETLYADMDQAFVEEMVNAGFRWGGTWQEPTSFDSMHFDIPGSNPRWSRGDASVQQIDRHFLR